MRVYLVVLKEFKDSKHNIIDIAKSRGLAFLGMVKAASPIDGNISIPAIELYGSTKGTASRGLAELEETIEHRAVLANIEPAKLPGRGSSGGGRSRVLGRAGGRRGESSDGLRGDRGEEVNVIVRVEAANVSGGGGEGARDLHATVEVVVDDEVVSHADAMGLHGVALAVVVIADGRLIEVTHAPLGAVRPTDQRRSRVGVRHRRRAPRKTTGQCLALAPMTHLFVLIYAFHIEIFYFYFYLSPFLYVCHTVT